MPHDPHLSPWRRRIGALAIAAIFAGSLPASADWLVTRDGHRIETDGVWEVKGRTVVYTDPGGKLCSLRLAEVDLEASEATGEEPEAPPPPAAEPKKRATKETKKKPVLVLTNDDIPEGTDDRPAAQIEPEKPRIVMYSTDWCGVCRRARSVLADLGADYVEKDIEKSDEARREYEARFGTAVRVPSFDYDGKRLTGLQPEVLEKWVEQMRAR